MRSGSPDLQQALEGPVQQQWEADLYYNQERRLARLPITEPRLRESASQKVNTSGSLTIVWQDPFGTSITPQDIGDLLAPFGAELRLYCVIRAGRFSERVLMGTLPITEIPDADDQTMPFQGRTITTGSQVQVKFKDLLGAPRFQARFNPPGGPSQFSSAWLELQRLTGLPIGRNVPDSSITGSLVYQSSALDAVYAIAGLLDGKPHMSPEGAVSIRPDEPGPVLDELYGGVRRTSETVLAATNLIADPSFEGSRFAGTLRTNLCTNPSVEYTLDGWSFNVSGTGAAIDRSNYRARSGSWSVKFTFGDNPVPYQRVNLPLSQNASGGATYTASVYVWTDRPVGLYLVARGPAVDAEVKGEVGFVVGSWQRLTVTATADYSSVISFCIRAAGDAQVVAGAVAYIDDALIEEASVVLPYFDGSSSEGDFTCAWIGDTGSSASTLTVDRAFAVTAWTHSFPARSAEWSKSGDYSLRIIADGTDPKSTVDVADLDAGKAYTVLATVRLDAPQQGDLLYWARGMLMASDGGSAASPQAPNEAGEHELRWTVTVPKDATGASLWLANGAASGSVWWDRVLVVEVPDEQHPYTGPYFDGSTPRRGRYMHQWTGAVNGSTSEQWERREFTLPGEGQLVHVGQKVVTARTYNKVVVTSPDLSNQRVLATAEVTSGPLRTRNSDGTRSPYGVVPYYASVPTIVSSGPAQTYARSLLKRVSRLQAVQIPVTERFNPLRERGDVLRVHASRRVFTCRVVSINRGGSGPADTQELTVEVLDG